MAKTLFSSYDEYNPQPLGNPGNQVNYTSGSSQTIQSVARHSANPREGPRRLRAGSVVSNEHYFVFLMEEVETGAPMAVRKKK